MSLVQSSIDDYLVASFPVPAAAGGRRQGASLALHPPVAAVQYTQHSRQDTRLAVATPGVGFSVYDLADQTPLSSVTVGPSFAPTTAAVSRSTPSTSSESIRVKSARRTWVGVRTEEGKGEIWCWHEDERKDGSTEGDAGKAVWPISEPLAALAAPRSLPSHISFLSASGALALAPSDNLTSLASLPASDLPTPALSQSLRLVPISSSSAPAFLPASLVSALPPASSSKAHLALVVRTYGSSAATTVDGEPSSLVEIGKKKFKRNPRPSSSAVIDAADAAGSSVAAQGAKRSEIELVVLDPEVTVPDEFEPRLGLVSLGKVVVEGEQVVVSDDGFVTALGVDGTLSSSRLSFASALPIESYPSLFFPTAPVGLPSPVLTHVKAVTLSSTVIAPSHFALLALHTSFVALASPRPTMAEGTAPIVSVSFWDTRFGTVIASTDLTVPSAVAASTSALSLSLSLAAAHTAILTLSPSSSSTPSATSGIRTALFGLPLSPLPSASVLAAVVGKHALTARFLAAPPQAQSVLARAKQAEPLRSLRPGQSDKKLALQDASRAAREQLLEQLERALAPLKKTAAGAEAEQDEAVREAETLWSKWLESEKDRLWEYNKSKVRAAMDKEKERRMAAITGDGDEQDDAGRYRVAKRKIERAIAAAGASVKPGAAGAKEGQGKASWKDVTAARIKGVSDRYRYMYHRERNKMEEAMGKTVKEFDWDEAVAKVERYEPSLPSSFITALLRLSFPVALDAASIELAVVPAQSAAAPAEKSWRHPTKIVRYLLGRELVGENQIEGGVTRYLARAGDWPSILVALSTVPDIPETTTVSLLVTVVRAAADAHAADAMDAESSTLPAPIPSLPLFLAAFLKAPYTPATLRAALQKQLSATEAVPVLEQCDRWLALWLQSARPAEASGEGDKKRKGKGSKAVAQDVFKLVVEGEDATPMLDQIIPFVQVVLDAHFVTLLLQRQAHRLLRRLSQHVATHTQLVTDLSSLVGALSIYSRKKDEQRRAALEEKAAAASASRKADGGVREFGESMERRIKAQEKHAEVGEYTVETFVL
ncbi:hypothetical protein Rhopal_005054-T1 [Rhodotorula paludigena]|uniref:Uncharacterized protein n=1 Tax=Rhodotorula paludigena TaxID=86838 RepID=A0AAV5GHB7_9BASI|nr:hypothetical protein Rhopal_005054-T1 [Rhodotorula paludigena]